MVSKRTAKATIRKYVILRIIVMLFILNVFNFNKSFINNPDSDI